MLPLRHHQAQAAFANGETRWLDRLQFPVKNTGQVALNRIPPEARIAVVTTVAKCGTGILPVSVSITDAAQGEHRPEACATLITPPEEVRERFRRVKPLGEIKAKERGWTLDVLNLVRRLVESRRRGLPGRSFGAKTGNETPSKKPGIDQSLLTSSPTTEFTTADAYAFTRELEKLHPDSRVILETDSPRHHRLAVPDHNP